MGDDTWLDLVEWVDDASHPGIAAFFGEIDRLVSSERGVPVEEPAGTA